MTAIPLSRPATITDEEIAGGGEIHADAQLGLAESEPPSSPLAKPSGSPRK